MPKMSKLKIGVLGVGHLGKIHLKCIKALEDTYNLVGFYDPDKSNAAQVEADFGVKRFEALARLLQTVDVIDIVTPTSTHFELAKLAVRHQKHVFIEKPVTRTTQEAKKLRELVQGTDIQVQIGHVERFNPAFLAINEQLANPMFIEAHRLASFNPRGTDVSVVLDLMIHDLDILLHLVPSKVASISASGVGVLSDTPDIANARIEFENGCVANITASRISMKQVRKMRLFQKDAYISMDFLSKKAQVVQLQEQKEAATMNTLSFDTRKGKKWISIHEPNVQPNNAIMLELQTFAESIKKGTRPKVSLDDAYEALTLAHRINEDIERRSLL